MSQFRNLWDGIKFGASMLAGMFAGVLFLTPAAGKAYDQTPAMVQGAIVGTIAGGFAWQCYKAWRNWTKPPA